VAVAAGPLERSRSHCSRSAGGRLASQRQGRKRRTGNGRAHDRLLNRHAVLRGSATGPRTLARGHNASVAAMIAAASSSVGTAAPDTENDVFMLLTLRATALWAFLVHRRTGASQS
jgi:hypothetical protein